MILSCTMFWNYRKQEPGHVVRVPSCRSGWASLRVEPPSHADRAPLAVRALQRCRPASVSGAFWISACAPEPRAPQIWRRRSARSPPLRSLRRLSQQSLPSLSGEPAGCFFMCHGIVLPSGHGTAAKRGRYQCVRRKDGWAAGRYRRQRDRRGRAIAI